MVRVWKCEVRNSYTGEDRWTTVEIVGEDFKKEFRRRFGRLSYRNVKVFNDETKEWEDYEVEVQK